MKPVQKYESEYGLMKPSGVGQYVNLYDYRTLEYKYAWLIKHAWMSAAISKAKASELLGVALIDFDDIINNVNGEMK
jgi:hypothetical protein